MRSHVCTCIVYNVVLTQFLAWSFLSLNELYKSCWIFSRLLVDSRHWQQQTLAFRSGVWWWRKNKENRRRLSVIQCVCVYTYSTHTLSSNILMTESGNLNHGPFDTSRLYCVLYWQVSGKQWRRSVRGRKRRRRRRRVWGMDVEVDSGGAQYISPHLLWTHGVSSGSFA